MLFMQEGLPLCFEDVCLGLPGALLDTPKISRLTLLHKDQAHHWSVLIPFVIFLL